MYRKRSTCANGYERKRNSSRRVCVRAVVGFIGLVREVWVDVDVEGTHGHLRCVRRAGLAGAGSSGKAEGKQQTTRGRGAEE